MRNLWLSLLCLHTAALVALPSPVEAQNTTTRCYEIGGSVTCRTRQDDTGANAVGVLAGIFQGLAEADERIRREKLEAEQRRLLDEQLRLMQAADAARLALDAETRARREAQQRLYWSRATNALVEVADSLDFDNDARRVLVDKSQNLLSDLLTVNPQASTQEILDNLRPVIGGIHRLNRAFETALVEWVQNNLTLLRTSSPLEKGRIENVVTQAKKSVATLQSPAEVSSKLVPSLEAAKKWIIDNRKNCLNADSCDIEYLPPRLRKSADSVRTLAERKAASIARAEERARAIAARESEARNASLTRKRASETASLLASLASFSQFTSLDSAMKLRFQRRVSSYTQILPLDKPLVPRSVVEAVAREMDEQIDWCKGTVSCDSALVADTIFTAFRVRREKSTPVTRAIGNPASKQTLTYAEQFRIPLSSAHAIFGSSMTLEWSESRLDGRIRVSRSQSVHPEDGRRAVKVDWDYILGNKFDSLYQAESIELLFDEATQALVRYRHAVFSRNLRQGDRKPYTFCVAASLRDNEWVPTLGRQPTPKGMQNAPVAAPFVLAHLAWPTSSVSHYWWGDKKQIISSSTLLASFYGLWDNADPRGPADLQIQRDHDKPIMPMGGFYLRPTGQAVQFTATASGRAFDRWYVSDSAAACAWP